MLFLPCCAMHTGRGQVQWQQLSSPIAPTNHMWTFAWLANKTKVPKSKWHSHPDHHHYHHHSSSLSHLYVRGWELSSEHYSWSFFLIQSTKQCHIQDVCQKTTLLKLSTSYLLAVGWFHWFFSWESWYRNWRLHLALWWGTEVGLLATVLPRQLHPFILFWTTLWLHIHSHYIYLVSGKIS